ncbi:ABC transporter ATP-binding protein [bacterium]|nr:ABC transporter ATP-binding protein [bacterium]
MLRFLNICKTYSEGQQTRSVLHNASLELASGSFSALLGRSGSGKSTLLNLAAGLDRADQGEVWCDEVELTRLSDHQLALFRRKHLGFVFQFFHLFPTLNVEENLLLILELAGQAGGDVQSILRRVGLWDRRRSYPDKLSGGEQQRVAVARALVHGPKLVLADEPTGNLDQENGQMVLQLLKEMSQERQATLLVATHSSEVAEAADQVLRIRQGGLVVECS